MYILRKPADRLGVVSPLRTKWELEGVWGRGGADIGAPKSLILLVKRVRQMDVLQPFVPLGNSGTVPRGQKLESPLVCLRGGGKWWVLQSFYTVIFQQKGSACGGMVACDKTSEYRILGVGEGGANIQLNNNRKRRYKNTKKHYKNEYRNNTTTTATTTTIYANSRCGGGGC